MRSEAEQARIVTESLLPGAAGVGGGAQAWFDALADLRLAPTFLQRGALPSREPPATSFARLVVEEPLEERRVPAVKLEIAIGDVVVRTDAAIDEKRLSRVIRAVRASR